MLFAVVHAARPWSLTASAIPIVTCVLLVHVLQACKQASVLAAEPSSCPLPEGVLFSTVLAEPNAEPNTSPLPDGALFSALFAGASVVLAQCAGNYANTYYDFEKVDKMNPACGDRTLVDGRLDSSSVLALALISALLSIAAAMHDGNLMSMSLHCAGLILSLGYTAPPLQLKYSGCGEIMVFVSFCPVLGSYISLAMTGVIQEAVLLLLAPLTLLTVAILVGNNYRDVHSDEKAGITTLCTLMGKERSACFFVSLVASAYVLPAIYAASGVVPISASIVEGYTNALHLTLPAALKTVWSMGDGERLDEKTAKLHSVFGAAGALGIGMGWLSLQK
jgi:1,4-dihydroxy-2-naphthoate octaprenyltransferase